MHTIVNGVNGLDFRSKAVGPVCFETVVTLNLFVSPTMNQDYDVKFIVIYLHLQSCVLK